MKVMAMVISFAVATACLGDDHVLNLATEQPGTTTTISVDARTTNRVTVTIQNMVPTAKYNVTVERAVVPIPALDTAPFQSGAAITRSDTRGCSAVVAAFDALVAVKEESAVPAAAAALRDALASVDWRTCEDEATLQKFSPDPATLLASTQKVVSSPVRAGESMTLRVGRVDPVKVWTAVYSTGARGAWSTSYGVAYADDRDEEFFADPQADSKYKITRRARTDGQQIIPQVYFNWVGRDDDLRDWTLRYGGGIGYDTSAPVVSVGAFVTYNRNLSLVLGVMAQRQQRLSGKYQPDQVISEDLEDEQLHETTIRPNFFVGVSFRLGSDIFRPSAPKTPPTEAPETPTTPTRP